LDYDILVKFAKKNNLNFIAIYGSYYTNKNTENSDLDLIVESPNHLTIDKLIDLEDELNNILNISIDMITPRLMISSLLCGYVWRLNLYKVVYGSPIIHNADFFNKPNDASSKIITS